MHGEKLILGKSLRNEREMHICETQTRALGEKSDTNAGVEQDKTEIRKRLLPEKCSGVHLVLSDSNSIFVSL